MAKDDYDHHHLEYWAQEETAAKRPMYGVRSAMAREIIMLRAVAGELWLAETSGPALSAGRLREINESLATVTSPQNEMTAEECETALAEIRDFICDLETIDYPECIDHIKSVIYGLPHLPEY